MLRCRIAIISDAGNIEDRYLHTRFREFVAETQEEAKEKGLEKIKQSVRRWKRSKRGLASLEIPIEGSQGVNYLFFLENNFLTKRKILALKKIDAQNYWKQR